MEEEIKKLEKMYQELNDEDTDIKKCNSDTITYSTGLNIIISANSFCWRLF